MHKRNQTRPTSGFTIVELLIVIVIIGILATIVIVAYNGITKKAQDATLQSDLKNASTTLEVANATNGTYPADTSSLRFSPNTIPTYTYNSSNSTYCLQVSSTKTTNTYYVKSGGNIQSGTCAPATAADGTTIQTITTATCPTANKIRAVDARDNHTYWVQKLADGKCWMLTNLAYVGGGTNTYSDTKTLTNGTGGATDYANPKYYVVPSTTNFTAEPAAPSTSTNGTGQYGYLYNWCAAMGAPISTDPNPTSACANATTPTPDTSRSICPAGWRLPVGNGVEFTALNTAVNAGSTTSDSGLLNAPWLGQRSGYWLSGFGYQGTNGYYWSSTQYSATYGYGLYFVTSGVGTADGLNKSGGFAARCVAAV